MPMVLLHELGHSYHWHLDYDNPYIKDCYDKAMNSGVYEKVDFILGGKRKAYATTNQMEYFSECSEAFWGMNDFWPFVRNQLEESDPFGFEMCQRIWHLSEEEIEAMHQEKVKRQEAKKAEEEAKKAEEDARKEAEETSKEQEVKQSGGGEDV